MPLPVSRITVLRGGAVGDFVLTLPALRTLEAAFPEAELTLVGNLEILRLAPRHRHRDHNAATLAPMYVSGRPLPEAAKALFEQAQLTIAYTTDTGGPFAANLRHLAGGRVVLHDPRPAPGRHACDHLLDALNGLDLGMAADPHPRLEPAAIDRGFADARLAADARPLALLHPGSGGPRKRWPADRFGALAARLAGRGYRAGVVTGPAECELELELSGAQLQMLRPPDLNNLAGLLATADVYVGNDSGPTHMAAALGVPPVALFGPTDPLVWAPRGRHVSVVRSVAGDMASLLPAQVEAAVAARIAKIDHT